MSEYESGDVETYFLEAPPRVFNRAVFRRVRREAELKGVRLALTAVLFALLAIQIPLLFLSMPGAILAEIAIRAGSTRETVEATVTKCEATRTTVNGKRVYQVRARFRNGAETVEFVNYYDGVKDIPGYAKGMFDKRGAVSEGFPAQAEYTPLYPGGARLPGGRLSVIPPVFSLLFLLFFLPAPVLAAVLFRRRRRMVRLLRDGILAVGRVKEIRRLGIRVNKKPCYEVVFEYETPFTDVQTGKSRQTESRIAVFRDRQEKGEGVAIVIHPDNPENVVPLPWASPRGAAG